MEMDEKAVSTSHPHSSKSTYQKRKQLKKTKTLPVIKQTKTSMIRMVNANPLLLLHDKSDEEKSKLTGIKVPKTFDFQKTEEFIKATYGLFQRMMPIKSTSLTNLKGKTNGTKPIDRLPQKTKSNNDKNEQKNIKILKSNKEIVKYYKSNNNNNVDNSKNRRNLKENFNNNKLIPKGTKPLNRKEHKHTVKDDQSQEKYLPSDKFDTKLFMSISVTNNPSSSNSSIISPIAKEENYSKANLKAFNRAKCAFFSTPMLPKKTVTTNQSQK